MGKVVGTIAKVAAVVAIAYFAPAVAGKIVATAAGKAAAAKVAASALGSTISSAAAGAALGEAGGAVGLGTDWRSGLMAGGVGGSGLLGAPATTFSGAAQNLGGALGLGGAKGAAAAGTGGAPMSAIPATSSAIPAGALPAVGTGGAAASAIPASSAAFGGNVGAGIGAKLAAAGAGGTAAGTAAAGAGATGLAAGLSTGAANAAAAAPAATSGLLAGASAGLKKVAPSLLAAGLVGSGMSAQMRAQQAELEKARQSNAAFTQERFNQAQRLLGEADYLNPEYLGRQAGQAALVRGSIQEGEATRGLTGARLAAEQRRFRLGTARNVGTAFQQGFSTGTTNRLAARQAGIQSIPTAFPLTTGEGLNLERTRIANQAGQSDGWTRLLGEALGVPPLGSELPVGG